MAASTRVRVACDTGFVSFTMNETVATETPARSATSLIVAIVTSSKRADRDGVVAERHSV
jgi:hypothetical protein